MEPAAVSALAILAMLFGFLQEGLLKLEAEDYPGAIAAFTKVVEHQQADADLRDRALLWRAVAHGKAGDADKAKADLAALLKGSRNPGLRGQAFAAFAQLGGDPRALLPKETPKEALSALRELGMGRNLALFEKRLVGDLAGLLKMIGQVTQADGNPADAAEWVAEFCEELTYGGAEIGGGREIGTAKLMVVVDDVVLSMELVAVGDEWHFSRLLEAKSGAVHQVEPEVIARRDRNEQMGKLKQIGLALVMFAGDNQDTFPKELKQLVPYLGDESLLGFVDPATGKPMPLLYHAPARRDAIQNPSEVYVVALPVPIEDSRVVLFADGHVATVGENIFLKTAEAQGWKLKPEEPAEMEPDVAAKVEELVKRLGDPDPAARKAAYAELKALGDQATPVLEKHRDHLDPEIRLTIRQLLK
jgi:prepilin-type processing-associated H-X9-DG protein